MIKKISFIIFLIGMLTSCTEKNSLIYKINQLEKNINDKDKKVTESQLPIIGSNSLLYPDDLEMSLKYANYLIKVGHPREARPFLVSGCTQSIVQAQELYLSSYILNGCTDSLTNTIISEQQLKTLANYADYIEVLQTYKTIRGLNSQIAKSPTDANLYEQRANLFSSIKDSSEAIWDFNKALALDPTLHSVYYNRSLLYYACDQFTKAKNELLRYLEKTNDTQKEVYKQIITSLSDLEQQYSQQPKNPNYLNKRSRIFAKIGEYKRALTDMNYLIQTEAANADYYAFRAYLHYFLKNKEAALLDISEAERLSGKTNSPLAKKIREMN